MENYKQKEWLSFEYIDKSRSANDIAKSENVDAKTIWSWLKKFQIPTRPRGHNTSHLPKDGSVWKGRKHKEESKEKIRDARINDGHVPYLKNGEHWLKSVSKDFHPNWQGGLSPERQSVYSSQEWVNAVKEVWKRDNGICQRCGSIHNNGLRGTFHIHHKVSFKFEKLRTISSNLVLLCKECHNWVHSKDNINKDFIEDYKNDD